MIEAYDDPGGDFEKKTLRKKTHTEVMKVRKRSRRIFRYLRNRAEPFL